MADIVTLAGSPSHTSRSLAVLEHVNRTLNRQGLTTELIQVRNLSAEELIFAQQDGATIAAARAKITQARALVIATPVYKAAYSGVLKTFLDLLPQNALTDKIVFPIATGGSAAHLLAIDYALKPVLSALGAQHILTGLYILDGQIQFQDEIILLEADIERRLQSTLQKLTDYLLPPQVIRAVS